MKYTANKDFTAIPFPTPPVGLAYKSKTYKKGDVIDAGDRIDFGKNKHLVSYDGFDIPVFNVSINMSGTSIPLDKNANTYQGGKDGIGWMPKPVVTNDPTQGKHDLSKPADKAPVLSGELTQSQTDRLKNITMIESSMGLLGFVGGIVYAKKTGGHFWRYVGWSFAGSLAVGLVAMLATTPFKNKTTSTCYFGRRGKSFISSKGDLGKAVTKKAGFYSDLFLFKK